MNNETSLNTLQQRKMHENKYSDEKEELHKQWIEFKIDKIVSYLKKITDTINVWSDITYPRNIKLTMLKNGAMFIFKEYSSKLLSVGKKLDNLIRSLVEYTSSEEKNNLINSFELLKEEGAIIFSEIDCLLHYYRRRVTIKNKVDIENTPETFLLNCKNDDIFNYTKFIKENENIVDIEVLLQKYVYNISNKTKFSDLDVLNAFFDIGWSITSYPYFKFRKVEYLSCDNRKIRPLTEKIKFPEKYIDYTYQELRNSDWFLRNCVEDLFSVAIETSPLRALGIFWNIVLSIGKAYNEYLSGENYENADASHDFDNLFLLSELCIITYGPNNILSELVYLLYIKIPIIEKEAVDISDIDEYNYAAQFLHDIVVAVLAYSNDE